MTHACVCLTPPPCRQVLGIAMPPAMLGVREVTRIATMAPQQLHQRLQLLVDTLGRQDAARLVTGGLAGAWVGPGGC